MGVRFPRTISIVASACAAMIATPSLAADYQLGTLQTGVAVKSGGNIGTFYNPTDRVFFSLSGSNNLGTNVVKGPQITITPAPAGDLTFYLTSLTANLYTASGTFVSSLANIAGPVTSQTATLDKIAAGNYYISVAGTAVSPLLGGTYGLSLLTTQAAAAPGPAGILFVGGAAALMAGRRRRQKAKAALA
jgi:hypothetical protein